MSRVIALIDLDCFYCQVEQKRLGISPDIPLAVSQWGMLLAVNYTARKFGIGRKDNSKSAKEKCPDIQLVSVELIQEKGVKYKKVSLERYRNASSDVFEILSQNCSNVQKASVDEAYCDITDQVNSIIMQKEQIDPNLSIQEVTEDRNAWIGNVLPSSSTESTEANTISDIKLMIGSRIIHDIRTQIYEELGFTCSAGIAHGKSFAKLIASYNKPNGQTILRKCAVEKLLESISLTDLPGLGGKLGLKLVEENMNLPLQLRAYSMATLISKFGNHGVWLYNICRGIDEVPVKARIAVQSIMVFKRFAPIHDKSQLDDMCHLLCLDLVERMKMDQKKNLRIPSSLTIFYSKEGSSKSYSLSSPMPSKRDDSKSFKKIVFQQLSFHNIFPITRLGIKGSNFIPVQGTSIQSFFKSSTLPLPLPTQIPEKVEEPVIAFFKCQDCGKLIKETDRLEHGDFHFALQVSKEVEPTLSETELLAKRKIDQTKNSTEPPSKKKQKKSTNGGQRKINEFFAT